MGDIKHPRKLSDTASGGIYESEIPLGACKSGGWTDGEAEAARHRYGPNALTCKKPTSFFRKFLEGFSDPIIRILLIALGVNFLFLSKTFDIPETLGILAAILASTLISALSERGGEQAFARLQAALSDTVCLVRRGGEVREIPIAQVVAGDRLFLRAGERIPADGVLTAGAIRVDLASLNGEGEECEREAHTPLGDRQRTLGEWIPGNERLLLRGSVVTGGDGEMLVLRTGDRTLYGSLTEELQTETRDSPLRRRLGRLAKQLSLVGYVAAALVALISILSAIWRETGGASGALIPILSDRVFIAETLLHALTLALSVLVMAVPEGLPMMISVVLSSNIRRMQKGGVLVRKPVGIETAGSMDLLFCDKTGTLTRGTPTVTELVTGDGTSYPSYARMKKGSPRGAALYLLSAYYNTQCHITGGAHPRAVGGNAAERALLDSVLGAGRAPGGTVSHRVPFDSVKKYSSVRVDGVLLRKGAPEVLLPYVTHFTDAEGAEKPYDPVVVSKVLSRLTGRGGRVLAILAGEGDRCLLVCLVCVRDDLRPGARDAVSELRGAGIDVVMITGDNKETAAAIARRAGILTGRRGEEEGILTSEALSAMDDGAVAQLLPRLRVVARALPGDKSRLVRIAQAAGKTVGMTGDGVNDAPALRAADVGFALGGGTEVAQEAGDIVILDDDITSIARAVLYGRTVFKSIRKFIMFQMTTNLSAVGLSVLCPLVGIHTPVTVLQMLWINLIMDTLGSLAFAGEAPARISMREPPKPANTPILNRYMAARTACMIGYLLVLCISFAASPDMRERFDFYEMPVQFLGAFFALFIFSDIANSVSARTVHPNPFYRITKNPAFLLIFSCIIGVQLWMIYHGGALFRTYPLSGGDLLLILCLAASVLIYSVLVKAVLGLFFRKDRI